MCYNKFFKVQLSLYHHLPCVELFNYEIVLYILIKMMYLINTKL